MGLLTWNSKASLISPGPSVHYLYPIKFNHKNRLFMRFKHCPLLYNNNNNNCLSTCFYTTKSNCRITFTLAKKKKTDSDSPLFKPAFIHEVSADDDDDDVLDNEEDEFLINDDLGYDEFLDDEDYFKDEYIAEDTEVIAGDGAEGGGVSLAGTWWDKEALILAEDVTNSFDGNLKIYAFRTLANATIQVRIEKLSTKYGSPSMDDIEAFSTAYRTRLDDAELAKTIPENISLEVSSPGVERVLHIPQELDRFKERPMYVKYVTETTPASSCEHDGVFKLVSVDLETNCCTWGLADVRINREKAGKGRPMSKKQREWRLTTPFDSIRLVRLYSEI